MIKKLYPRFLILVKIGSFYNVYEEDSLIFSYLFGYKLKITKEVYNTCSFQITSKNKVFSKLEENQISYLLIDSKNGLEIKKKVDFKRKNQYNNFLKIALPYMRLKNRLENLCQNILNNIQNHDFDNELENIESVLYKKINNY